MINHILKPIETIKYFNILVRILAYVIWNEQTLR